MATKRTGLLMITAALLTACAATGPTGPDQEFAELDRWDGEPVVETAKVRAARVQRQ